MFHWFKKHTHDGNEIPDSTPAVVNIQKPLTLAEQILRFTKNPNAMQELQQRGMDSFDDADDLDVEEDSYEKTPYEEDFNGQKMPSIQTRLDELAHGMVEEMPVERVKKTKSWFQPKKEPELKTEAK